MNPFIMSNYSIDVTARGCDALILAMKIAFAAHHHQKATDFFIDPGSKALAFFYAHPTGVDGLRPFAFPMPVVTAAGYAWGYLESLAPHRFGPISDQPFEHGWRLRSGNILTLPNPLSYADAIVSVEPVEVYISK